MLYQKDIPNNYKGLLLKVDKSSMDSLLRVYEEEDDSQSLVLLEDDLPYQEQFLLLNELIFFQNPLTEIYVSHINAIEVKDIPKEKLINLIYYPLFQDEIVYKVHVFEKNIDTSNNVSEYIFSTDLLIKSIYSSKTPVLIDFYISDIDIDTNLSNYSINLSLSSKWLRNDLLYIAKEISEKYYSQDDFVCETSYENLFNKSLKIWTPIIVPNSISNDLSIDDIKIKYEYDSQNNLFLGKSSYNSKNFLAKFNQELQMFPFDKQILNLKLEEINDISEHDYFSIISNNSKYDLNYDKEYEAYQNEWIFKNYSFNNDYEFGLGDGRSPILNIDFELERKPQYYFFKVFFPILVILLLLYFSFHIPALQIESKLTLTVVCFLALVAYIFVIDDSIPKLEYMTYLDYFILISFVMAALPNIVSIIEFNQVKSNGAIGKYLIFFKKLYLYIYVLFSLSVLIIVSYNNNFYTANYMRSLLPV